MSSFEQLKPCYSEHCWLGALGTQGTVGPAWWENHLTLAEKGRRFVISEVCSNRSFEPRCAFPDMKTRMFIHLSSASATAGIQLYSAAQPAALPFLRKKQSCARSTQVSWFRNCIIQFGTPTRPTACSSWKHKRSWVKLGQCSGNTNEKRKWTVSILTREGTPFSLEVTVSPLPLP